MSLSDMVSKILLDVRASTGDARAELDKLNATEKKLGETRAKALDVGNAGLEKWIGLAGQLGAAAGVAKVAFDAFESHAQRVKLESAAAGVSIEGLSRASHGLRTNLDLLGDAAFLNKTQFHATQLQMQEAEGALFALTERGNDANEVWGAMREALSKGALEPLEKYGIRIDKTGLSLDEYARKQEIVKRLYAELGKVADESGDQQDSAVMKTEQGMVRLQNAWDSAKDKVGEVVAQIGSSLLPALASSIERTAKLVSMLPGASGGSWDYILGGGVMQYQDAAGDAIDKFFGSGKVNSSAGLKNAITTYQAQQAARPLYATDPTAYGMSQAAGTIDPAALARSLGVLSQFGASYAAKYGGASGKAGPYNVRSLIGSTSLDTLPGAGGFSTSLGAAAGMQGFDLDTLAQTSALTDEWFQKIDAFEAQHDRKVSLLESVFGPAHEIDLYIQGFDKLGSVFNSLTDAVGASYEAIVTGQGDVSKAFKTVFADGLMAMGKSSAVEAIRETALGFGSLALGPIGGASASAHFTSAAMHAAVAVAAGAAAHSIGTSAQAAASDKAAAKAAAPSTSSGASSGSQSSGGGTTIVNNATIVYSDAFAADSPRQRALHARQLIQQALGGAGGHDS